jgi:hypothetical protein
MITVREPRRSRQQRPFSLQIMRTFSTPLAIDGVPFVSGAAFAVVTKRAAAPTRSETESLFITSS